jgi:hypothetical protein
MPLDNQLTDGGPSATPELPAGVAGPPVGGVPGSASEPPASLLFPLLTQLYAIGKQIPMMTPMMRPLVRAVKKALLAIM